MSMLPIIDILDGCQTDRDRADWLLRVPDGIVLRDFDRISSVMLAAGFHLGAEYAGMRLAGLHATRDGSGDLPPTVRASLEGGASAMRVVAFAQRVEGGVQ